MVEPTEGGGGAGSEAWHSGGSGGPSRSASVELQVGDGGITSGRGVDPKLGEAPRVGSIRSPHEPQVAVLISRVLIGYDRAKRPDHL